MVERAQEVTPARIGIGRTGTRMKTRSYLQFRIDHSAAQDAVLGCKQRIFRSKWGKVVQITQSSGHS